MSWWPLRRRSSAAATERAMRFADRGKRPWARYAMVGGFIFLALVLGSLLGLGAYFPLFGLISLVVAGAVLSSPRLAVWITVFGALCVSGVVELYLPSLQAIRWMFSLLSVALVLIAMVRFVARPKIPGSTDPGLFRLGLLALIFVLCITASAISAGMGAMDMLIGYKNYFQMWGLLFALALFDYTPKQAYRFIGVMGLIALVQMPLVLHQYFVLVPLRTSVVAAQHFVVAVDVVSGTFGGSINGGGRSNDLAILAAIAIVFFFARWKAGQSSMKATLALSALAFMPMLFSEVKLALVLIPVGMFMLFPDALIRRPFAALAGIVVLVGLLVSLILIYANLPSAESQRSTSVGAYLDEAMAYNIGDKGYGSSVLNRSTVYRFWWREHLLRDDWKGAIFGHGPLSSSPLSASLKETLASKRYPNYSIGLTGWSTLLWDTGLLGTMSFLSLLSYAYLLLRRMERRATDPQALPYLLTARIAMPMFLISLLHNNYIAFDVGFQTMLVLCLGFVFAAMPRASKARVSAA